MAGGGNIDTAELLLQLDSLLLRSLLLCYGRILNKLRLRTGMHERTRARVSRFTSCSCCGVDEGKIKGVVRTFILDSGLALACVHFNLYCTRAPENFQSSMI